MAGKHGPRKLLIASVGVATMNYVLGGCGHVTEKPDKAPSGGSSTSPDIPPTSGNLPAPGGSASGGSPTVANLPAPVMGNGGVGATSGKAGSGGGAADGGEGGAPTSGNLPAPPLPGGSGGQR